MQQITALFEGHLRIYVNYPDEASQAMTARSTLAANREKDPLSVHPWILRLGSLRLGSLRLGSLRLGSLRLGSLLMYVGLDSADRQGAQLNPQEQS
jgi:hypothetical protein